MDARRAIREALSSSQGIVDIYLQDLADDDLLVRPCEGANHINWQWGHLIASEHGMLSKAFPGRMPPLPPGFAERYDKRAAASEENGTLQPKASLAKLSAQQREVTLQLLDECRPDDLDAPTGIDYAPTVGALFIAQATHWLMHAGQWAIIRRQLGRPPLI